ncbi:MAG: DNA topoisomerase IV subunit A [Rhodospirillaceae bacterium]|nr:DNA topoisomerase IV subunit A [Rhodospirillaceae bacterium]
MNQDTPAGDIRPTPFAEALSERYLAYAMSTIVSRSLPDVRDGLKPVHRRLLFAMRQLRLDPRSGFKKCARVVGDVIGRYHPHGEAAVYDAMVRLAQEFAVRYPLVDGQGNFGNIDGDNAAAMRYTEARLTEVAEALLVGIDEDTVDFRPNYDGEEEEPVVLPARFPNLLANGSTGIAVGMATSVPPHNVGEICGALRHLIKHPGASIETLVGYIKGPDFPTGGVLVEPPESIVQSYSTGRGAFRLRARWEVEKLKHGQWVLVVTEIPYQVQKSRIVERIAELLAARKLPWLADLRDESTEDVRLVLEPKSRTVEPEALMEALFRVSDLEVRIPLNMNVVDAHTVPGVMNLRQVLQAFLDHRREVLCRRSRHRLETIGRRLEILEGYLVVYLNIDEVIRIVREEDQPKAALMATFDLTEVQAEAVLNMRLRNLRKLEEMELKSEHGRLSEERDQLEALLGDEDLQWRTISDEVADIDKRFGGNTALGRRRTALGDVPETTEVPLEAMVEREPITVVCSKMGWIRSTRGHIENVGDLKYKAGDEGRFHLHAQSTDKLLIFATNGRFYTVPCDRLPRGRGFGEPLRLMIDLEQEADIIALRVHRPGGRLLVAAKDGRGFFVSEDEIIAQTRAGRQVLNLSSGGTAALCIEGEGDTVAVVGDNHKLLLFPADELPTMGRGRGVILQKFKDGGLADAKVIKREDGLTWRRGEGVRTVTELDAWIGRRGNAGRLAPRGFPTSNRFDGGRN